MAPEQTDRAWTSMRAPTCGRSGVTLFEMLTGRLPFQGATLTALALAITTHRPTPLRTLRPEVPEALARFVDRTLERDPDPRTITADDIAAQWRGLAAHLVGPSR